MTVETIEQIEAEAKRISAERERIATALDDHGWKASSASDRGLLSWLRLSCREVGCGLGRADRVT